MAERREHADLVLTGGRIFTADAARTWADAPGRPRRADRRGRRRPGRVASWSARATRVIDLRGRTVTPGFGDAHVHPLDAPASPGSAASSTTLAGWTRTSRSSRPTRRRTPTRPWILGGGWSLADFPGGLPRREDLDRVVPDRPVFLANRDGHTRWVNTQALELAGITADTPTRPTAASRATRTAPPTGTLHEGATALVERLVPAGHARTTSSRALDEPALPPRARHHQLAGRLGRRRTSARRPTARSPSAAELTARVVGALWWERDRGLEQIEELVERRASGGLGRYRADQRQAHVQDGDLEN